MKNKQGISLIVLIVTIIVIIILAAAVILTLNQNNPIDSSRIAQLADNRTSINHAINMYYGKKMAETQGVYDTKDIFVKNDTITDTVYTTAINNSIGTAQLGTTQYYTLDITDTAKNTIGVVAPDMSNATWYIDVDSGLVYLAYDSADKVPSWMKDSTNNMDSTLDQFVRVVKDNDLVEVGKAS